MDVNEFIKKFNSLSDGEKSYFLAYLHGSVNSPEIKKYQIIESAFESTNENAIKN